MRVFVTNVGLPPNFYKTLTGETVNGWLEKSESEFL